MSERTANWAHRPVEPYDPPLSLEEINDVISQYPESWRMICLPARRGQECACRGCLTAMRLRVVEQEAWVAVQDSAFFLGTLTAAERREIYESALQADGRIDMVQRGFTRAITPEELDWLRDHPLHQDTPTNG